MPEMKLNKKTGERRYVFDDGSWVSAPPLSGSEEAQKIAFGHTAHTIGRNLNKLRYDDDSAEQMQIEAEQAEADRQFAPVQDEYPISSLLGGALPTGMFGSSRLLGNIALGGVDGMLTADSGESWLDGLQGGMTGATLGDMAGRVLGRTMNAARGLADDIRIADWMNRGPAENPVAAAAEASGYKTLASQRLEQGSDTQKALARAGDSAASSLLPNKVFTDVPAHNQRLLNERAGAAIDLQPWESALLDEDALDLAVRRNSEAFDAIQMRSNVGESRNIRLPDEVKNRLLRKGSQVRELYDDFGKFPELENGEISPRNWKFIRETLADDAHGLRSAARPKNKVADEVDSMIDYIDGAIVESSGDPELLTDYARVREQYRNLQLLQKNNVIMDGNVKPKALNRTLRQNTGYGQAARTGNGGTQPETRQLIEDARTLADDSLRPRGSSWTAERTSLDRAAEAAGEMAESVAENNWGKAAKGALRIGAPIAAGASEAGAGRMAAGLYTDAPKIFPRAGALMGRNAEAGDRNYPQVIGGDLPGSPSYLDQALFPLVGSENDLQRQ